MLKLAGISKLVYKTNFAKIRALSSAFKIEPPNAKLTQNLLQNFCITRQFSSMYYKSKYDHYSKKYDYITQENLDLYKQSLSHINQFQGHILEEL